MKWIKPSPDRFKCNVNASFSEARNRVGIGVCIRDDEGRYVLAKTEWMSPILDLDLGEALGLSSAMYWIRDLQLSIVDFELDSKTMVDSLYGSKSGVSNFSAVINDYIVTKNTVIYIYIPTNVFAILQHLDQQQKQVFSVTLWSIWKHRNNKVWNNLTETAQSICARA